MSQTHPMRRFLARVRRLVSGDAPVVPVVRLEGVIIAGGRGAQALNLVRVEKAIEKAFSFEDAPAVALLINSPGGSPVQSKLIHDRIRQLAEEKKKPVLAFCEDAAASGGYMIAVAADEIFCDPASIVGSIGVISASFGFTEAMEKIGVERRLRTAGDNKTLMDPFSPLRPEQEERLDRMMDAIHQVFIDLVKSRRGDRLKPDPEIFSGAIYTGKDAEGAGLVDGLTDMRAELRERFGEEVRARVINPPRGGALARLMPTAAAALADEAERRAWWARLGL